VSIYLTGVACALALIACEPSTQSSTQAEPPSLDPPILRTEPVKLSVDTLDEFLVYAATSPVSERETVRKMVSEQAGNEEIGIALQKSFQTTVGDDFDFALVQLSVLGELRAENSIPFFTEILTRKVRDGTRDLEHGLSERDMLNMLQVKAVQGLAYLQNPEADEVVLETAAEHHSRAVRSAAVQAMLYNAGDKDGTRARLEKVLRQEDRSLLDLVRRTPSTEKEEFNNQLAEYYRKYPEEVATAPGEPTGQTAAEYRDEEDSRDEAAKPQRADK
jgi:hypothetical protein